MRETDVSEPGVDDRIWLDRRATVLLVGAGCLLVVGSYVSVFWEPADVRSGLWGGLPDWLRSLNLPNMLLAAIGFFPLSWLLLVETDRPAFERESRLSYGVVLAAYALLLVPSALWLPLTVDMIENPDPMRWISIRIVLFAAAAGAIILLWLCLRLARARPRTAAWLGVAGALPLVLQTAVFDALIWPAYFPD